MCAMTKSIRMILMPFLVISYVFGLRIPNLFRRSRLFNILYMLLVWSVYYFFSTSTLISTFYKFYPIEDRICSWAEIFVTLLSIVIGIYHDKKFWNCLKKLDIVDNTLLKLGTMTDYDKLRKKTLWFVLGWVAAVTLTNCSSALLVKNKYDCHIAKAMCFIFTINYCCHINFIGDLTTASILEYTGLKFDQINEHLQNLMRNNKRKIIQAWENPVTYPRNRRFSKTLSDKCIIWIVIHLHLELRKISYEIDSIFGTQMTFKMAYYFGMIAIDLREILYAILINNYVKCRIMSAVVFFLWFSYNVFKFLLINYLCEIVSIKARTTADLLNKLSYFTCDVEIHETISQFSLQIVHAPLRFCGIGLFRFGFKFLYMFIMNIATVLVIIIQARAKK
ncbi:uncharacterized protein [Temnothorax longispinosus]